MDASAEREAPPRHGGGGGGGEVKEVKKVIKVVVMVVMLGYLFMWFIMPTNMYKTNWKTKLTANLSSTYFGTQGTYYH